MSTTPLYGVRLVRERTVRYSARKVDNTRAAARAVLDVIVGDAACEHLAAVFLDNGGNVIGAHVVAVGGIGRIDLSPKDVFRGAIVAGAASILLGHNHPSGDPTPSPEDREITAHIVAISKVVGIPVIDHVVVTRTGASASFLDLGILPP